MARYFCTRYFIGIVDYSYTRILTFEYLLPYFILSHHVVSYHITSCYISSYHFFVRRLVSAFLIWYISLPYYTSLFFDPTELTYLISLHLFFLNFFYLFICFSSLSPKSTFSSFFLALSLSYPPLLSYTFSLTFFLPSFPSYCIAAPPPPLPSPSNTFTHLLFPHLTSPLSLTLSSPPFFFHYSPLLNFPFLPRNSPSILVSCPTALVLSPST